MANQAQTSSKRRVETGNQGVSCSPHLRSIGLPLNPMECGKFQYFRSRGMFFTRVPLRLPLRV